MISPRRFEPGSLLRIEQNVGPDEGQLAVLACVVRARPHGESEWAMGCRFSGELHDDQLQAFGATRARPDVPDPRGWARFPCDTKAFFQRVSGEDQVYHAARVLNISVSGMALEVDDPVSLGELLSTELHDSTGRPVVNILACVVHIQTVNESQILGCNFIRELGDRDLQDLL